MRRNLLLLWSTVNKFMAGVSPTARDLHALAGGMGVDVVALDHAIERFAIDGEEACCGLLVSAGVVEDAGDVTTLDFGKCDPVFDCGFRCWCDIRLR